MNEITNDQLFQARIASVIRADVTVVGALILWVLGSVFFWPCLFVFILMVLSNWAISWEQRNRKRR